MYGLLLKVKDSVNSMTLTRSPYLPIIASLRCWTYWGVSGIAPYLIMPFVIRSWSRLVAAGRFNWEVWLVFLVLGLLAYVASSGCAIWCVELLRREILKRHPKAKVNAILIDFFLYDTIKEREVEGQEEIPHHRTRSIWYWSKKNIRNRPNRRGVLESWLSFTASVLQKSFYHSERNYVLLQNEPWERDIKRKPRCGLTSFHCAI